MRTVVLDPDAPQGHIASVDPLDDTYRALEWSLAHNPRQGVPLPPTPYYGHIQEPPPLAGNSPPLWVIYTFDEYQVTIAALVVHRHQRS